MKKSWWIAILNREVSVGHKERGSLNKTVKETTQQACGKAFHAQVASNSKTEQENARNIKETIVGKPMHL